MAVVLGLGALAGNFASLPTWGWLPARALDEPWRWWTAAFVHFGHAHLGWNLLACAVVGAFGDFGARALARQPPPAGAAATVRTAHATDWALAWLTAWPLTHGLLLLEPRLGAYGGLSGVLHAGVAVAVVGLLAHGRGRTRLIAALVFAGMLLKLALEQAWLAPVQPGQDGGLPVAVVAHASGVAAGLATGLVALALRRRATMRSARIQAGLAKPP